MANDQNNEDNKMSLNNSLVSESSIFQARYYPIKISWSKS